MVVEVNNGQQLIGQQSKHFPNSGLNVNNKVEHYYNTLTIRTQTFEVIV